MTTMKTKMLQPSIFLVLSIIAGNFCTITEASTPEDVWQSLLDNPIGKADNKCPRNVMFKPVDCADHYRMGRNESRIYEIWPMSRVTYNKSIRVFCDMETDGGGWTVIQRRGNFSRSPKFFFKYWINYKEGFGNMNEDFWLGNDDIFALTNQKLYSARFEMKNSENEKSFAVYDRFWIDDENNKYTLHISGFRGEAGDSMEEAHNNKPFSTVDQDNDNVQDLNCGYYYESGWWFQNTRNCYTANLNGVYNVEDIKGGIYWKTWKGKDKSKIVWTEIKIRPNNDSFSKMKDKSI